MALGARRARVAALVFVHIARMALVGHDPGAHWCTSAVTILVKLPLRHFFARPFGSLTVIACAASFLPALRSPALTHRRHPQGIILLRITGRAGHYSPNI